MLSVFVRYCSITTVPYSLMVLQQFTFVIALVTYN